MKLISRCWKPNASTGSLKEGGAGSLASITTSYSWIAWTAWITCLSLSCSILWLPISVFAGDTLRLKVGNVQATDFEPMDRRPVDQRSSMQQMQQLMNQRWMESKNKAKTKSKKSQTSLRKDRGNQDQDNKAKRYFVVQFKDKIRSQDHSNLTSLDAKVVRYLPDDALVVKATARTALAIRNSLPDVHTVVPFRADWKISLEFEPASVFSASNRHQILIRLFPQEESQSVEAQLRAIPDLQILTLAGRSIVVEARRSQLDAIAAIEGVEWVQISPEMELFHFNINGLSDEKEKGGANARGVDPISGDHPVRITAGDYSDLTGYEAGTKLMGFETAWGRGFIGRGQTVAMADTGLDRGDGVQIHGDFAGRVPQGFIFGLFSKSWEDPMGHGTHVAGSVLSSGAASGGRIRGGAFEASLLPESMWSPMLGNLTVPPKLRDLFVKADENGARVHTNSWGSPRNLGAYDGYAQQVDEFTFTHPDMLIVFAAGNSGEDADKDGRVDAGSVSSPGTAKNALTVGASKNYVLTGGIQKKLSELKIGQEKWGVEPLASSRLSENAQGLAAFSSRGPTQDGRLKPEIVAPGTNILSTRSQHPEAEVLWGEYNRDYVWSGGTSMATPLVAGAAAVVRQYLIENRKIAAPSAAIVKAVLMHTAQDLFPGQFGAIGKAAGQELLTARPNPDEGYGRVDMTRATDLGKAVLVDDRTGLAVGEAHSYPIHVDGKSKLTATLVYTDAPGAAGAARALVNDLDLVVADSKGNLTTLNDRVNNSEMIEMDVTTGDYEVKVKATNVPQGIGDKQPYALILSVL